MLRYPEEFISSIRDKIDIVDLIGNYINLQKKGRDYWACCPFHSEKTPSFQIRVEQQVYRCFGCGKFGNVFKFLMEYEKISFNEAVEILAKKCGLILPQLTLSAEEKSRKELLDKIYKINIEAARFYHKNIFTDQGRLVQEYFFSRQLEIKTVNTFGIGYSIDYSSLPKMLLEKGYDQNTLIAAGICSLNSKGELIDFFAKRMVIPIISYNGQILGFSGRVLEKKPNFLKYKNTPATLAFNKRKILFGLNLLKKYQKDNSRSLILVEGHMDLISLFQYGFHNVVASMGTSLTPEQCKEIKRYADCIYVSYDGDSAGQSATLRGLDILMKEGLEVKVVCLENNLDPDDYIKKFGRDGYLKLLDAALPLVDYKLKCIENKFNLTNPDHKIKYVKEAISVIKDLDIIEKEEYSKIVSAKSGISQATILEQIKFDGDLSYSDNTPMLSTHTEIISSDIFDGHFNPEKFIVSSLVNKKNFVQFDELCSIKDYLSDEILKEIVGYIVNIYLEKKSFPKYSDIISKFEDMDNIMEVLEYVDKISLSEQEDYYKKCIEKIKYDFRNKEIKRLIAKLNSVNSLLDRQKLMEEIKKLTKVQPN